MSTFVVLFATIFLLFHSQGLNLALAKQLNCTSNMDICHKVCNETAPLEYSATFCDPLTGDCVCDCRDMLEPSCSLVPFTPCFQACVARNPNPQIFLYLGANCPIINEKGQTDHQCACACEYRLSVQQL